MRAEVKEIPFSGGTMLGVRTPDGKVWLAVKKVCLDIGLSEGQAKKEIRRIESSILFKGNWIKFDPVQKEGSRDVRRNIIVIAEKFVPMWLAQINITPTMQRENPEAAQKLLSYQLEAADVLHKAFYETEEQKSTFDARMGLEGKIEAIYEQMSNVESMMQEQSGKLNQVVDNMTLTTRQQQRIYKAAKDRINHLLGGAHSEEYKSRSKSYFINLWNGLKAEFDCGGSYKDLNPVYFDAALGYIGSWRYVET